MIDVLQQMRWRPAKLKKQAEQCKAPDHGCFPVAWYKHSSSVLTRKLKSKALLIMQRTKTFGKTNEHHLKYNSKNLHAF